MQTLWPLQIILSKSFLMCRPERKSYRQFLTLCHQCAIRRP
uniref:Alternative protein DMD n=1 Tax=Homo sapiens TaxID=9606 RepID=L8E939_HUMAN|nr:alternative protein DMD [Homo sapiens]